MATSAFEPLYLMWYQSLASFVKENPETLAVGLNYCLDDATLVPEIRKPFDVLAEGLISRNSRGDRTGIELFLAGIQRWETGLRRRIELQVQQESVVALLPGIASDTLEQLPIKRLRLLRGNP
jgi:hypothetical protein